MLPKESLNVVIVPIVNVAWHDSNRSVWSVCVCVVSFKEAKNNNFFFRLVHGSNY